MESQKSDVSVKISRQQIDFAQKIPKNSILETFKGNILVSSILPSNKKTVQVIDLESRSILASFEKQGTTNFFVIMI